MSASGYVWHDFTCIPQPLAQKLKLERAAGAATTGTADGGAPPHAGMVAPPHAGMIGADHRKASVEPDSSVALLAEQLKSAVDSIPSYVERSTMLWILVPPCDHHDIEGAVCDFNSWRSRGWCRMEVRQPPASPAEAYY